jgi:ribosomal protein S21
MTTEENKPSHNITSKYATLMETSGEEQESWYYFIKVDGNEEALKNLQEQLEKVDWYILEDLSTFDMDLDYYVSASTAKEMTKLELNHCSFHRKFDGKLKNIDFEFKKKDGNETKICKVFDVLGYGQIEEFIDDEDIDDEDLRSNNGSSDSDDSDDTESSSDSSISRKKNRAYREKLTEKHKKKDESNIPPSLKKKNK